MPAPRVLLVDDDPDILTSMETALRFEFPEVEFVLVANADAALREVSLAPVDVIVVDHRLPGTQGIDFLRELHRRRVQVPRILITAFPDAALLETATNELRVEGFLNKPFSMEDLQGAVRGVLQPNGLKRAPL